MTAFSRGSAGLGDFSRLVVAEAEPGIVRVVREAGGRFRVNVFTGEAIEAREIGPIEIEHPATGAGNLTPAVPLLICNWVSSPLRMAK